MRDVLTMTIDPADAKDFDDALSLQKLKNGNIEVGHSYRRCVILRKTRKCDRC